jgi:hypothetical protein
MCSDRVGSSWSTSGTRRITLGGLLLKGKVLNQGYLLVKFKSSLRKDYGRLTLLTATEYLCHK